MDALEKELRRLSHINPTEDFLKASKGRLMSQIQLSPEESWLKSFLKKAGGWDPSDAFLKAARQRVLYQIQNIPQTLPSPWEGLSRVFRLLRRVVASTLVMTVAVTAVLFQLEGNTVVEASEQSYLEVLTGSASLKRSTALNWETIGQQAHLQAGDLIQIPAGSQAVVHFFDDTQVRLNQNSTFLISQLAFSPAFNAQGIIQASLEQGQAWVQTLNVEDGYAGFTLHTREAVLKALSGSFSVTSAPTQPVEVAVFTGALNVSTFASDTGKLVGRTRLTPNQKVVVAMQNQLPTLAESNLDPGMKEQGWVKENLKKDEVHLMALRQQGYDRLTLMAGTLPGDMLYSVKQAKERLKLAWTEDQDVSVKIEIANNRLNEGIVLLERGDREAGQAALMAYQKLAQEISTATPPQKSEKLMAQLVVPHQKILMAQPTDKNSMEVKETLQKTAEILATNPLEKEKVRLKNSVADLQDIMNLVQKGDLNLAKEKLTQHQVPEVQVNLLAQVKDPELKKDALQEVLDLRKEEKVLLTLVSEKTSTLKKDSELAALVQSTTKVVEEKTEEIRLAALPILPELEAQKPVSSPPIAVTSPTPPLAAVALPQPSEAEQIAAKINLYMSWDGQYNQIQRLLEPYLNDPTKIDFLLEVQSLLKDRAYSYLGTRILQLRNQITSENEEKTSDVLVSPDSSEPINDATSEDGQVEETVPKETGDIKLAPLPLSPTLTR